MKELCNTCGKKKLANRSKASEFSWRKDRKSYESSCKACRSAMQSERMRKVQLQQQSKYKDAVEKNPHGFLAAAIIELAIRERQNWQDGGGRMNTDYGYAMAMARVDGFEDPIEEIEAFFASAWFDELAGFAGCEAEYLRKHIALM